MINKKIGIIGCGNMGEAILSGLSGVVEKSTQIMVSEMDARRRENIVEKHKIIVEIDNNRVVKFADVIIIAVKPKDFESLLENEICCGASEKKLVISIAAGVTTRYIEKILGKGVPVVRAMPNMGAAVSASVTSLSAGSSAGREHMALAREIFATIGDVVEVSENLVDAVTAVSGSGPAYFFYLVEALEEAARQLGLDDDVARTLVMKTAFASSVLLEKTGEEPSVLRERVTSKGGTTEAAFKVLMKHKVKQVFIKAVKEASKRSKKLSKG